MVVTIDTEEKCLLIYPRPDWDDIQRRVEDCRVLMPLLDVSRDC